MEDPDEITPYLPERYKQKVRAKQQQRRVVRILSIALIIAAIAILILFVFFGIPGTLLPAVSLSSQTHPGATPPITTTNPTVQPTPGETSPTTTVTGTVSPTLSATLTRTENYSIAPDVPTAATNGSLPLSGAMTALREYYPANTFTITAVNYSAGPSCSLFGFTLKPAESRSPGDELVVFIDAATGLPWAPGEETAAFPREKVKSVVLAKFPDAGAGTARVWYHESPEKGGFWMFILASGNMTLVSGSIDPTTGEILTFSRNIPYPGRPAAPSFTEERAQSIASKYINDNNGGMPPLNLTSARYHGWGTSSVPAAGEYIFSWERRYLDRPVDLDSITVAVDALTGDVIGYDKQWTTPDYAFSQTVDPSIGQRDATFAVMEVAKSIYPESVENIRILSSELRWNNRHIAGTTLRPGSVPLAWKIVFDDETIRSDPSLPQGIGWVDIQTGNVTELEYRH